MRMAMGTHKQRVKHEDIWIAHTELRWLRGMRFYQRLNGLLERIARRVCRGLLRRAGGTHLLPTAYETAARGACICGAIAAF